MCLQQAYIGRKLKELGMHEVKPARNPCISDDLEAPADGTEPQPLVVNGKDHALYRQIIGTLLYASNCTRADITFVVSKLSRYVAAPCQHHLTAAKHVLRYLRGTADLARVFKPTTDPNHMKQDAVLCGYSDSDWAGCKVTRKPTTGIVIAVFGNTIHWNSKKQSIIAQSSCEADYIAVNMVCNELLWFQSSYLRASISSHQITPSSVTTAQQLACAVMLIPTAVVASTLHYAGIISNGRLPSALCVSNGCQPTSNSLIS